MLEAPPEESNGVVDGVGPGPSAMFGVAIDEVDDVVGCPSMSVDMIYERFDQAADVSSRRESGCDFDKSCGDSLCVQGRGVDTSVKAPGGRTRARSRTRG